MDEYRKILEKTNDGLNIFVYYLGENCLKGKFKSPFRDDNRASCRLYRNNKNGMSYYYLHDFGDSSLCGNAITTAARKLGMNPHTDFKLILETIDRDLCLGVFDNNQAPKPSVITSAHLHPILEHKVDENKGMTFTPIIQEFQSYELDYWNRYGIDLVTLQKYNVYSLKGILFTKSDGKEFCIYGSQALPAYGYFFNSMQGVKVYRPKATNRFMYAGQLPHPYMFGWDQLPEHGQMIIITGGEKDVMSLSAHGYHAIALNSETAKIPESLILKLSLKFDMICILYDADETGITESQKIVGEYKDKYPIYRVQLPLAGTKAEKDISDYFAQGHNSQDLQSLIDNIKK